MKTKGRRVRKRKTPERSTRMEKVRPRSELKVMSPNPRVVITVSVQ
jgi:hypothetical protein